MDHLDILAERALDKSPFAQPDGLEFSFDLKDTNSLNIYDYPPFLEPFDYAISSEEQLQSPVPLGHVDIQDPALADISISLSGQEVNYTFDFLDEPMDTYSRNDTVATARTHDSAKAQKKKQSQRAKISNKAKETLEAYFKVEPYPSSGELELLASSTGLTVQTTRTWFGNARSRKNGFEKAYSLDSPGSPGRESKEGEQPSQATLPRSGISPARLETLDRLSPAPSASSLDRYLATSIEDDAISEAALRSLSKRPTLVSNGIEEDSMFMVHPPRQASTIVEPASSVFGSMSSVSSARSMRSWTSQISVDSRGSRRGRKRWRRLQNPPKIESRDEEPDADDLEARIDRLLEIISRREAELERLQRRLKSNPITSQSSSRARSRHASSLGFDPPFWSEEISIQASATSAEDKCAKAVPRAIFCTWLSCSATFQYRYEWARHEEAVHYCPYHWVCCLDDATAEFECRCFICGAYACMPDHLKHEHNWECAKKPLMERTFLREDQLTQHVKRMHLKPRHIDCTIPKHFLAHWKIVNPNFDVSALRCGFCGRKFESWMERQYHVFEHIQDGCLKFEWLLERTLA